MRTPLIITALAALYAAPVLAQDAAVVQVAKSETYGEYLTDADGRPLYLFTTDKPEGSEAATITCTSEECLNAWPLFTTTGEPQAGEMADAALLGTMDYEGETVVTYNGWPLYYFAKDEGADEPQGNDIESFGGEWYLVQSSGEKVEHEG
jgi:predicted lipoprotein with Yx(FWY)xxD motif